MPSHILYAYVEGSDLMDIADKLIARFSAFIESRHWTAGDAWPVNQRHRDSEALGAGDHPDWDLGLNLCLPSPGSEPVGWYSDIIAIAQFLGILHRDFGRDFIIGIGDEDSTVTTDLFSVECAEPNLNELRSVIGIGDVE